MWHANKLGWIIDPVLEEKPFTLGAKRLTAATWADNLDTYASNPGDADELLAQSEQWLKEVHDIDFKEDSMKVIYFTAVEAPGGKTTRGTPIVASSKQLGIVIAASGDPQQCVTAALQATERCFWKNSNIFLSDSVPIETKMKKLNGEIASIWLYRAASWPWSKTLAHDLDKKQKKLTAISLKLPKYQHETWDQYHARRCRSIGKASALVKPWSLLFLHSVIGWASHICRDHLHIARDLLLQNDARWLQTQRMPWAGKSSFWSLHCGKTTTRARSGKPQVRWSDILGTQYAHFIEDKCKAISFANSRYRLSM